MWLVDRWPLMWKSTHRKVQVENHVLRDALREANLEVKKHQKLLAGIRSGAVDVVGVLDRMAKAEK